MTAALRRTVGSFEVPNYRRWFAGQLVSISGNWMQIVAEMWLVLTLTGSALAVGVTSALQFLPILLFGAWGGLVADSVPKRRLLILTQALMAIPPLVLFGLSVTDNVAAWMVMALVLARGIVLAVDLPARQSYVIEIVGTDRVVSAVGLQSVLIHTSRITGPAIAGILIAGGSIELCFLLNAMSFGGMILALRSLDRTALAPPKLATREPGAIRKGFHYVTRTPELAIPMAMMAVIGTLGLNFHVLLPLLARQSFGGGPESYSALVIAMGAGAVAGAIAIGGRERIGERWLVGSALAFGSFCAARDGGAQPRAARCGAGSAWRGERHIRGRRQLDAPAQRCPRDARTRHGTLLDRVHGLDADRRADRRRDLRGVGRASRARPGGRVGARDRRGRSPGLLAPSTARGQLGAGGGGGGFARGARSR